MVNELLNVPQYHSGEIKIPNTIDIIREDNGVSTKDYIYHPSNNLVNLFSFSDSKESKRKAVLAFYDFHAEFSDTKYNRLLINWLEKLESENLPIHKFITIGEKTCELPRGGEYILKYVSVREEILSFLLQKIGQSNYLLILKDLFAKPASALSDFNEFLEQKAQYLSKLDIEGLQKELQEDPYIDINDKDSIFENLKFRKMDERKCPRCGSDLFIEDGYETIFRCKRNHIILVK